VDLRRRTVVPWVAACLSLTALHGVADGAPARAAAPPAWAGPAVAAPPVAAGRVRISARTLLGRLPVVAETRASTYRRAAFPHWTDADRDGCDTRREVLIAESRTTVTRTATCVLRGGSWFSDYDGVTTTSYGTFDVDHVVALAEAWGSGASTWKAPRRERFANDLGHPWTLQAVTATSNRAKSAKDPAQWLPARSRCTYAIHWTTVKYRWKLSVDEAEHAALAKLFAGRCGLTRLVLPSRPA
jgi:hypothetical protein